MNKKDVKRETKLSFSIVRNQYLMSKIEKPNLTLNMIFKGMGVSNKGNRQKTTKKLLLGKETGLGRGGQCATIQ